MFARELAQHLLRTFPQRLLEHRARVQGGHAAGQRLTAGAHEDAPRSRPAGRLHGERHGFGAEVQLLQPVVGALRERDARHETARIGDPLRVGIRRRPDLAAGEQAVQMQPQGIALVGAHAAWKRRVPVGDEIGAQRGAIEVPAAEQHQVGLQRVVDRLDMVAFAGAQPPFEPGGDAGQEGVSQRTLVGIVRCGVQHLAAVQSRDPGCSRKLPVRAAGLAERAQRVQRREQRGEVGRGCCFSARHVALERRQA